MTRLGVGAAPPRALICQAPAHISRSTRRHTEKGTAPWQAWTTARTPPRRKYAHDEELAFKANARRAKLLGLWAAEQVGKSGADAEAYAKSVVMADFEEAGDEDVFRKVRADLDAGGRNDVSDHVIRRTMDELMAKAIEQVKAGS